MSLLFSSCNIKNLTLKNRIVMAPMCMRQAENGYVSDFHHIHYGACALGEVALIILEAVAVSPEGRIMSEDIGIWDDLHIKGLTELCQTIQKYGARAGIQIAHAGRKSLSTQNPVGAGSARFSNDYGIPKQLSAEEVQTVILQFVNGIRRAVQAGFDLIEIHAAHGYLLNQFLSSATNQRTDQYGGSLENRTRILKEIITETRNFYNGALAVRLSAVEYINEGNSLEDTINIVNMIKEDVDFIDISSGGIVNVVPNITIEPNYQVPFSEAVKKQTGILTGAVGLITTGTQAEEILQKNQADLILLGRSLLRDPHWALNQAYTMGITIPNIYNKAY